MSKFLGFSSSALGGGFPPTKETMHLQVHNCTGSAKTAARYPGGRLIGSKIVLSPLSKPPKIFLGVRGLPS